MQPKNTPQGLDDAGDESAALQRPSAEALVGASPLLTRYMERLEKENAKVKRQLDSVRGNWQKAEQDKTDFQRQIDELTDSSEREKLAHNQQIGKYADYDTIKADLAAKQNDLVKATTERELAFALTKPELQHLLPLYQANALNLRGDDGQMLVGDALNERLNSIAQRMPAPAAQQPPPQQPQQPQPYGGFFQQPPNDPQRPAPQSSGQTGGKTLAQIQELLGKASYGSTEYDTLWGEYEKAVVLNENATIKNPLFD